MLKRRRQGALSVGVVVVMAGLVGAAPAVATGLPDGRGYELVSPAAKGGGDVTPDAGRVRTSLSGDAVNFSSLTAFGDAVGTGISTEYVSQRTAIRGTQGWQTHAILPRVNPLSFKGAVFAKDTIYRGEFSEDLSTGVLQSFTPLTDDPNVATVLNLYRHSGQLSNGPGTYELLTGCPACVSPLTDPSPGGQYQPKIADTTPDLGHVIFEAGRNLTADAPPYPTFPASLCNDNPFLPFVGCAPRLYEWDHGTLRLAGILPDGTSAPVSIAGFGATGNQYTLNTISDDGSKIFFTMPSSANELSGDLYMRLNHTSTLKLNASERTDCATQDPCSGVPEPDPNGAQPAFYRSASADGTKVFFNTTEQLTDAPGSPLYVYDTTLPPENPAHLRHVFHDQQSADGATGTSGLLGTSSDGNYAYFIETSAILPGQEVLPSNAPIGIYVWHQGTVSFIGAFNDALNNTVGGGWALGLGSRVSPDGKTLLFSAQSGDGLTGYDHGTSGCGFFGNEACRELYRYRADSGQLTCVSCNPSGATATSDAIFTVQLNVGGAQSATHLNHPLSDDGNHVFFESGERLSPADTNGNKTDVYQWSATGSDSCAPSNPDYHATSHGCLALLSSGTSTDDSHFLDASPSGRDVFFSTNQRLVGWDTDTNYDLYDARVGGGLPDPPGVASECTGERCQGSIAQGPTAAAPSSSRFFSQKGVRTPRHKAAKKCAKGTVRKRVHGKLKCVKKARKHPGGGRHHASR